MWSFFAVHELQHPWPLLDRRQAFAWAVAGANGMPLLHLPCLTDLTNPTDPNKWLEDTEKSHLTTMGGQFERGNSALSQRQQPRRCLCDGARLLQHQKIAHATCTPREKPPFSLSEAHEPSGRPTKRPRQRRSPSPKTGPGRPELRSFKIFTLKGTSWPRFFDSNGSNWGCLNKECASRLVDCRGLHEYAVLNCFGLQELSAALVRISCRWSHGMRVLWPEVQSCKLWAASTDLSEGWKWARSE